MEEVWKPVVGFEGLYEVSSLGAVRSLDRFVDVPENSRTGAFTVWKEGVVIKPQASKRHEYLSVGLHKLGKTRLVRVHRVVATAFLGPAPLGRPYINHKDLNKVNNRLDNLEYCSPRENTAHAREHGRLHKWTRNDDPAKIRVMDAFQLIAEGDLNGRQIDEKLGFRPGFTAELRRGDTWMAPESELSRPAPLDSKSAATTPGRRRALSLSDAQEVVALWQAGGLTQSAIAKMFGVTQSNVSRVVNGKIWAGLTAPSPS